MLGIAWKLLLVFCWIPTLLGQNNCQVDLAILVDTSGSTVPYFNQQLRHVIELIEVFPIKDDGLRVAVWTYSEDSLPILSFPEGVNVSSVVSKMRGIKLRGGTTNVVAAWYRYLNSLQTPSSRPTAKKGMLMITDGRSGNTIVDIIKTEALVEASETTVFVSTESFNPSPFELRLYTGSAQRVFINDYNALRAALKDFIDKCPTQKSAAAVPPTTAAAIPTTTTAFPTQPPTQPFVFNTYDSRLVPSFAFQTRHVFPTTTAATSTVGTPAQTTTTIWSTAGTPARVNAAPDKLDALKSGGFQALGSQLLDAAVTSAPECRKSDVIFVVDSSSSSSNDWNQQVEFLIAIAKEMNIAPEGQHVTLIEYGGVTRQVEYGFDDTQTSDAFLKYLRNGLRAYGGTTRTQAALDLANQLITPRVATVVLVSDGVNYNDAPEYPARSIRQKGVQLISVSVTSYFNREQLLRLTTIADNIYAGSDYRAIAKQISRRLHCTVQSNGQLAAELITQAATQAPSTLLSTTTTQLPPTTTTASLPTTRFNIPDSNVVFLDSNAPPKNCQKTADIIFVIDNTNVAAAGSFDKNIGCLAAIVKALNISPLGQNAALVQYFAGKSEAQYGFNDAQNSDVVVNFLKELRPFVGIPLNKEGDSHQLFLRPESGLYAFVMTDGLGPGNLVNRIAYLRTQGAQTFAISLSNQFDRTQMERIAGNPGDVIIGADTNGVLQALKNRLRCAPKGQR